MIRSLAGIALAAAACGNELPPLHVTNRSDTSIAQFHVTPVGNPSWSPNLLDNAVLLPGEFIDLDLSCGIFDVMLIDTDHAVCELDNVDLCLDDAHFVITDETCP